MVASGVTPADVRLLVGIKSTDVSDADMNSIITNAEFEVERILNTTYTPRRILERYITPTSPSFVMLHRTPVTKVVSITAGGTDGTAIDPAKTILYQDTGRLQLTNDAEKTQFDDDVVQGNLIDYYYAKLEDSRTETTVSATTGTGSDITISVGSTGSLSHGDYVKFVGYLNESPETTEITDIGTGTFRCDLSWNHFTGSRVIKQQVPDMVKELIKCIGGIMTALHMVGSTYTFATSYSIPEMSVTKGVPYPHFEKVVNTLTTRRDYLLERLRPEPSIY